MTDDLKFEPSDFRATFKPPLGDDDLEYIAEQANRILQAKLDAAPIMKLTFTEWKEFREWNDSGLAGTLSPTHEARLVYIREVEK